MDTISLIFSIFILLAIIRIFIRFKGLFIAGLVGFIILVASILLSDDADNIHYVNVDRLELLDNPFGNQARVLIMNDTLRIAGELNDNWIRVAIGTDTLYFQNEYEQYSNLGRWAKIQDTPFTKNKALVGQEVRLNHPDGFMELGSAMYKNGDILDVIRTYKNEVTIRVGSSNVDIDVSYIDTDWNRIKRLYPLAQ